MLNTRVRREDDAIDIVGLVENCYLVEYDEQMRDEPVYSFTVSAS